ncbi:lysozyme inhibitor LprI family protein [Caballeronia glebae]|uniref:lysozyme inhibitor LprI family protein n=1 Tax=Caballeronia glebae TaxID=1777143 RepID=UPI000B358F16
MRYVLILLLLLSAHVRAETREYSQEYQRCIIKGENIDGKAACVTREIGLQKKRLNAVYGKLSVRLSETDRSFLDKVQHDWLTWRDGNYGFLSEHVAGEYVTTRRTSLDFLLNAVYDRADELEVILTELGD